MDTTKEPISNNSLPELSQVKRTRRRHSPAFKTDVLSACNEPGASIAAVAQRYQLNANLIHKWRKAAQDPGGQSSAEQVGFIPVAVPTSVNPDTDLQVTITLGQLTIQWPISYINQAVSWLKALQA